MFAPLFTYLLLTLLPPPPPTHTQALTAELPQFLLTLLESPMEECDSPAAAKAQIVKALKAMTTDLASGEVVSCTFISLPYVEVQQD